MKWFFMTLVAFMLSAVMFVATPALASHGENPIAPVYTTHVHCVKGVNHVSPATFLGSLESAALDYAAIHGGGYWALPNGSPFLDQTPSEWAITHYKLTFTTVTKGACAVPTTQISHSFVCHTFDNSENPDLVDATEAARRLNLPPSDRWHNPVAVSGNFGGTVIGTLKAPWTLHCGATAFTGAAAGFVDFGGDLFGPSAAPGYDTPGMYRLGSG